MVFHRKSASDHLLSYWTCTSWQNDSFLPSNTQLLEEIGSQWISDAEYFWLETLLQNKESQLVYRYIDLQTFLRTTPQRDSLHVSIELEKKLENFFKNAEDPLFPKEVALRTMEKILYAWGQDVTGYSPSIFTDLNEDNFGHKARYNLKEALSAEKCASDPYARILIEDLLEKSGAEGLEYWNRVCTSLEQILLWKEILEETEKSIQMQPLKVENVEALTAQLVLFEKELTSFYKLLGKLFSENILKPFSEVFNAALLGIFRNKFHMINQEYSKLKSFLLKQPMDLHLWCSCHFSKEIVPYWGTKSKVLDLNTIQSVYPSSYKTSSSLLIFTCGGGRGHLSVTKAMSEYAKGSYHVQVANTLEETLASTDVFKRMLFNFSQEKLYNHLLRNEEFEWLKLLTSVGPFFLMMQQESIEKQIRLEVLRHHPDLLISCFPILNAMFLNVAKELNLPLLMVTTDLDTGIFTRGMHPRSCDLQYPKWKMTLAYDTLEMRTIIEKRLPPDKVAITGFPLRFAFNQTPHKEDIHSFKERFLIEEGDRVLIIMIGGMAGRATEKYATILSDYNDIEILDLTAKTLHVICLCGDQKLQENRQMRLQIQNLVPKSTQVKIHAIGALDDIAILMSIADALITKPGGCTTNEALAKGLPMIFHAPFALMDWEVFNMEFCVQAKMGFRFKLQNNQGVFQDGLSKNKQRLFPLLKEAFVRKNKLPTYSFGVKDFGIEFLKIVKELLDLN